MIKKLFFMVICTLPIISNGMTKERQLAHIAQQESQPLSVQQSHDKQSHNDDQIIVNNYIHLNANSHMQNNTENAPVTHNTADNKTATQANLENQSTAASVADAQANPNINMEQNQQWHSGIITDFFATNKKRLFFYTLVITYGTLYYHVEQGNQYLQDAHLWSVWHRELPLSALQNIPHEQLMKELLTTIQQRYLSMEHPTNFVIPLSTFLQELAHEEKNLRFYRKLYFTCARMWIKRTLPFTKAYRKIGARLRRINFLRASFVTWVSNYNINQNTLLR